MLFGARGASWEIRHMLNDGPLKQDERRLIEGVLTEQRARWKWGDRLSVEDYLTRYPALSDHPEDVLDLIYQEFRLRRRLGESPSPAEYVERFPEWSEALVTQFAMDEVMRSADGMTEVLPDETANRNLFGNAAATDGPAPVIAIEGYEFLGELGRGGMGVVYKARDTQLGRVVALKTITEIGASKSDQIGRFLDEAQAAARLQHPNIITVHAIGQHQGRPYFALEFVEGGDLKKRLADKPMAPRQAAELVEILARAVQAAHKAGIIHRDLKPSNILLTGEGVPKVSDFGLAKLLGGDSARTESGQVVGTPSYMAPEQAEGRSKKVGPAADGYSLGAILYEALTGRPPFLGDTQIETLRLVSTTEPVPPRQSRPDVPPDVETICLKCLQKEPAKRYASAQALADDLRRFLDGRPIVARPVGLWERSWRWCSRNPLVAGLAGAVVATLFLGTTISIWQAVRVTGAQRAARLAEAATQKVRDSAERSRDRALGATRMLFDNGRDLMLTEEMRPFRKALSLVAVPESQALVQELKGDPPAESQLVEAYISLAKAQRENDERAAAIDSARKAVDLAESLFRRDRSLRFGLSLGFALQQLSVISADRGALVAAARRSTATFRTLIAEHPDGDHRGWLAMIALNDSNIGYTEFLNGRYSESLEFLRAARAGYESASNPGNPPPATLDHSARNDLYLGQACRTVKRFDEAIAADKRAADIYRKLIEDHPTQFEYAWQLYLAQREVAVANVDAAKWHDAFAEYETARKTLKTMGLNYGGVVSRMASIQGALAVADFNLSEAYENADPVRYAGPMRAVISEAYEICAKLSLVLQPFPRDLRKIYAQSCFGMADYQEEDGANPDLDLIRKSEQLWEEILLDDPGNNEARGFLVIVRRKLADELADRGRFDEASRRRSQSLSSARGKPELLYQIATVYVLNAGFVGKWPTKLDIRRLEARRRRFLEDAVSMLREARAAGLKDLGRLRNEPTFASIRSTPEFKAILTDLVFADPFAWP